MMAMNLSRAVSSPLRAPYSLHRALLLGTSSHLSLRPTTKLSASYSTTPPPPLDPTPSPQPQPPTDRSLQSPTDKSPQPTDKPRHKILNKENIKVQTGKLRTFIRKYGPIGIGTYFGMYGLTLAGMYALISSGLLMANDAISMFKAIHLDKLIDLDSLNPKTGNFAIAWILTKFTEPIRFGLTIAVTPSIYRFITGRRAAREEDEDDDDDGKDGEKNKKDGENDDKKEEKK